MKKNILALILISSLLFVVSCNKNNKTNVEGIAYVNLPKSEQGALSDKHGVVKKIKKLPENVTITNHNFNDKEIYSVTFKYGNGGKIIVFVDAKNKKMIGTIPNLDGFN